MHAAHTDYYGPGLEGEFTTITVEDLQGGDIIPSHDGLYHMYEGHVVDGDNAMVNFRRCRCLNGSSGEAYSVDFHIHHPIKVLV